MFWNRNVIDKQSFDLNGDGNRRISYDMIFKTESGNGDQKSGNGEQYTEQRVDIQEKLDALNRKWEDRLVREKNKSAEKAYREGFIKGNKEACEQMETQIEMLNESLEAYDLRLHQMVDKLKPHLINMVFDLAEKVLDIPVQNDRLNERIQGEITSHLDEIEEGTRAIITIGPAHEEIVKNLLDNGQNNQSLEMRVSENLKPGEYRIETKFEKVIRDYKKQLNDLRETVGIVDHDKESNV